MFVRRNFLVFIFLLLWGVLPTCTVTNDDIIQKQLFDLNWKFSLGDQTKANEKGFNESNWRSIDLPHDWRNDSVLTDLLKKAETESKTTKSGWYIKNFEIPENWVGKKIIIEFEGINTQHEIFVNGVSVKSSENGKQQTKADLTPNLKLKGNNKIAIRIDVTKESGLEWKAETGIFRHVWLIIKDKGKNP